MPGIQSRYIDADKIRRMLAERKITRQAAADQICISAAAISAALKKGRMSDLMIEGIAALLQVDPADLYADEAAAPGRDGPRRMIPIKADLLRALMRERKITQAELARMCSVALSTVQRMFQLGSCSNWMLDVLCRELGIPREDIT